MTFLYNTSTLEGKIAVMVHVKEKGWDRLRVSDNRDDGQKWRIAGSVSSWNWSRYDYNILAEPTIKAWTLETVPKVGLLIRRKDRFPESLWPVLIYSYDGLHIGNTHSAVKWDSLLAKFENTADGGKTWHPCGTVEDVG